MNQKNVAKFFFQVFLLSVLLFGLVHLVISKGGLFAEAESVALVVLVLLSAFGLVTYNRYGQNMLFLVYSLFVVNIVVLWLITRSLYFTLLLVSLLGLWVSMPPSPGRCDDRVCKPAVSSPPPQKVGQAPVIQVEAEKEKAAPIKAKFTPGKYVASKRSNVYHEPKCEWAKKIQKARQVWFASREEALDKGYKKHDCVK